MFENYVGISHHLKWKNNERKIVSPGAKNWTRDIPIL